MRTVGDDGLDLLCAEHSTCAASSRDAFAGDGGCIADEVFACRADDQLAIDLRKRMLGFLSVLAPEIARVGDGD